MHGAAVKENIENQFLRKAPSKTILEKKNKKIVLKKQKQKKGTSKNQLNPVGAAVSEARPAEAGTRYPPNCPPSSIYSGK